jgi:hypothetical protein
MMVQRLLTSSPKRHPVALDPPIAGAGRRRRPPRHDRLNAPAARLAGAGGGLLGLDRGT